MKQQLLFDKNNRIPLHRILNKQKSKYRNEITEIDGIKFHSRKEADYYSKLRLLQQAGKGPDYFLTQVPIRLPGGVKYVVDFLEVWNGEIKYVDVKGKRTANYITKKKMVEALYPIKIIEV